MNPASHRLPEPVRSYLAAPCLRPLWDSVRARLERSQLAVSGSITLGLDDEAAHQLAGLLGTPPQSGTVRVSLPALDAALRASRAQCGLLTAVADLTGSTLTDRRAPRSAGPAARTSPWPYLEEALVRGGLGDRPWAAAWTRSIRTSGLLSLADPATARTGIEAAVRVLAYLRHRLNGPGPPGPRTGPARPVELCDLAARTTGDPHGLEADRLTGALVLCALAAAAGTPLPPDRAGQQRLWRTAGVLADQLGDTVLVLGLRPPGPGPWARAMRTRAELHLPSHLTSMELAALPPDLPLVSPQATVHVCDSHLLLQAAAHRQTATILLCTQGAPSATWWDVLTRLLAAGTTVLHHGDFDWPSIAVTHHALRLGARPWRMSSDDYRRALADSDTGTALTGPAHPTGWDPDLHSAMLRHRTAVREETLLPCLLDDLTRRG
ncbi:TIGR02679 domain-containing protein [Streptomyces spectabilis]|uniref:TIGR02679 domain-containing protein n=1 Tax=Streptomyces spectabilis TaxID=68270 RepID=UPI0033E563F9